MAQRQSPKSARRSRLPPHFARVFVLTEADKLRMAQVIVGSPLQEFELPGDLRFQPAARPFRVPGPLRIR